MNKNNFENNLNEIKKYFSQFNFQDIVRSLFISDTWLPNISSNIKHKLLIYILLTINKSEFKKNILINSYEIFSEFLKNVYRLTPSFPSLEDYIPKMDWGDIKYCFKESIFKIFYSCELIDIYDYINIFKIQFCNLEKEFMKVIKRSPNDELYNCLMLQDKIISGVNQNCDVNQLSNIKFGHLEIPNFYYYMIFFYCHLLVIHK